MIKHIDQEISIAHGDAMQFVRWWNNHRDWTFRFRYGAVPGIHRRRWHKGCYYRSFSYRPMKKLVYKAIEDDVKLRQKWGEIPDPWDDYPRKHLRCWKDFRETQYKWTD